MPGLLWLAPLPGLAAALLAAGHEPIVLDPTAALHRSRSTRRRRCCSGGAALLWSAAGAYARCLSRPGPGAGRFAAWWLLTLSGSLGVFIAGDLGSFYLAFAVVSLAAFGLVVHDGTPRARHAAAVYLLLAVLGEVCLLLGLRAAGRRRSRATAWRSATLVAALPGAPGRDLIDRPAAGRLRAEGRARAAACLAAAGASGGADAGLRRAQRRHHQGRHHRPDPLPAARTATLPDWGVILAGIGAADRLLGRRAAASPSATRRRCWPIPASARWASRGRAGHSGWCWRWRRRPGWRSPSTRSATCWRRARCSSASAWPGQRAALALAGARPGAGPGARASAGCRAPAGRWARRR